jgi:hypothetical protein
MSFHHGGFELCSGRGTILLKVIYTDTENHQISETPHMPARLLCIYLNLLSPKFVNIEIDRSEAEVESIGPQSVSNWNLDTPYIHDITVDINQKFHYCHRGQAQYSSITVINEVTGGLWQPKSGKHNYYKNTPSNLERIIVICSRYQSLSIRKCSVFWVIQKNLNLFSKYKYYTWLRLAHTCITKLFAGVSRFNLRLGRPTIVRKGSSNIFSSCNRS